MQCNIGEFWVIESRLKRLSQTFQPKPLPDKIRGKKNFCVFFELETNVIQANDPITPIFQTAIFFLWFTLTGVRQKSSWGGVHIEEQML